MYDVSKNKHSWKGFIILSLMSIWINLELSVLLKYLNHFMAALVFFHCWYFNFFGSNKFNFTIIFLLIFPILLFAGFIRWPISVDKKFTLWSSLLQIRVFQLAGNYKKEFYASKLCRKHVENQLGSKRALEEWVGFGEKSEKLRCFYCVCSDNTSNKKIVFRKSKVN